MSKDQYEKGLQNRREIMGEAFVERAMSNTTEFSRPLQEFVNANCWGTVWDRPGLPRQTRSLLTLAMLTSLRASTELKGHVRGINSLAFSPRGQVLVERNLLGDIPPDKLADLPDVLHDEGERLELGDVVKEVLVHRRSVILPVGVVLIRQPP